jgi:hypothetical protein
MPTSEEWYVEYINFSATPHRNEKSRPMHSREAAIEYARDLERRHRVLSIVGPTGKTLWEEIT